VVHLLQKSGHEVQDRLKRVCADAGVPFRPATSAGWRGVVEGVAATSLTQVQARGTGTISL